MEQNRPAQRESHVDVLNSFLTKEQRQEKGEYLF